MRSRTLLPATAVLAAVALTACDDATGVQGLDDEMAVDAAMIAADATLEEVAMFREPLLFGGMGIPGVDPPPHPPRHPGPPGGRGSFEGELSGVRSVTFHDESGAEQDEYDPLTTASVHVVHAVEGTIVRDRFTADIARERDVTVTGLEGEETQRTWNGSGWSSMARSGVLEDGSERAHSAEGTFSFEDVVVPIPGAEPRWPISGTIYREMTMTRSGPEGTVTRTFEIVITFDGTSTATAVVNGDTMEIDLTARPDRNPLRRHRG